MLSATVFNDDGTSSPVDDPDRISDFLDEAKGVLWVDAVDPSEDELDKIQDEFSLHPLAMEDLRHPGQRPKIERYDTHAFLVAYASDGDPRHLSELNVFISEGWLISVRRSFEGDECARHARVAKRFDRTREGNNTVGFLLYTVLDAVVDTYFDALDTTEDELERSRAASSRRSGAPSRCCSRICSPSGASCCCSGGGWCRCATCCRSSCARRCTRSATTPSATSRTSSTTSCGSPTRLETQRELLGNAVDAHLAVVNNHMNDIMKKMTSWGAILFGAALITGIYGMNFDYMPSWAGTTATSSPSGWMLLLTIGLYTWFKRKGWL